MMIKEAYQRFMKVISSIREEPSVPYLYIYALCLVPPRLWNNLYPRMIRLPEGIKVHICDPAVLYSNMWDELINKEYYRVPEYIASQGQIIFDVGAHIGLYCLRNAKRVGERGRVYAFEPNPIAYYYLLRNISENSLYNIHAFPYALSDKNGYSNLFTPLELNLGAASFFVEHIQKEALKKIRKFSVRTITLDNFVKNRTLQKVDLMKIDVEGAEERVLLGGKQCLTRGIIRKLIIEVHEDISPVRQITQTLNNFNFRIDLILKLYNKKSIIYAKHIQSNARFP